MELRKRHESVRGWLWSGILVLASGLFLMQGTRAAEVEVGKQEVAGMAVRAWLDDPMQMQMQMQGKWMTFRPKAGELTHHLGIDLTDPRTGAALPTATVEATLTYRKTGKKTTKNLPAMLGKRFIYGTNLRLEKGQYDLLVRITPPTIMRMGPSMNRLQAPGEARFSFVVK